MNNTSNESIVKTEKKKMSKGKKVVLIVGLTILGLLLAIAITLITMLTIGKNQLVNNNDTGLDITTPSWVEESDGYVVYNGHKYEFNKNITSTLFMGVDKRSFSNSDDFASDSGQADALFLFSLDTTTGKPSLISISRDSMVDINTYDTKGDFLGTKNNQICLAYSYGDGKEESCRNVAVAVSRMFYGIPINSYVAIDMDAIGVLNDAIGGVPVTIKQNDDVTFLDPSMSAGSTLTLTGAQAEIFVRQRNGESVETNNNRIQRQKQYLASYMQKALAMTKKDLSTPVNIFNAAKDYTFTDINVPKVSYYAYSLLNTSFTEGDIISVPGQVKMGDAYVEFYPDKEKFYEMILDTYYTKID